MKQTKNKYLRRLVRNYEIELRRPKGLKLLDKCIGAMPDGLSNITIFVSKNIHKECDFIDCYRGFKVKYAAIPNSQAILCNENNLR